MSCRENKMCHHIEFKEQGEDDDYERTKKK